jgi:hypothetical protein
LSQSKALSVRALHLAGLPAPVHEVVTSLDAARSVAERLGWPVVVKPVDLDLRPWVFPSASVELLDDAVGVVLAPGNNHGRVSRGRGFVRTIWLSASPTLTVRIFN